MGYIKYGDITREQAEESYNRIALFFRKLGLEDFLYDLRLIKRYGEEK